MPEETRNRINEVKHLRMRAEYDDRPSLYSQGIQSLQEALTAFETYGKVSLMQQYIEGIRVIVWTRSDTWAPLEALVGEI